jgi:molecular chaperone GrpE
MDKIKIPVRVLSSPANGVEREAAHTGTPPARRVPDRADLPVEANPAREDSPVPPTESGGESLPAGEEPRTAEADWRDLALRLQAEMENFRRRQQRLAQGQIEEERQRLLRDYLQVMDNLERALAAPAGDPKALVEGVQLTRRALQQRLQREGVTRIEARGRPFDPNWHEAVTAVPHDGTGATPGTVIQVLEPGYRLGEQLLRPARVIVAV